MNGQVAMKQLGKWIAKWQRLRMDQIITMDRFGRLVLPDGIRRALHVKAPAAFKVEVTGNKVELTVVPETSGTVVKKRRGLLVIQSRGKKFNASDAIRTVREERGV